MAASVSKMTMRQAHEKFGHCSEDTTRKTAKALGIELSRGLLGPCAACAAGKAKQKAVPKCSTYVPSTENNGRMFLDIATFKIIKDGPPVAKPNWCIMVEERTNLKISSFYKTKGGMVEPTCEQLHQWKLAGKQVKYIRLDNLGENKKLKTHSDSADWKLNIDFEFTARYTPQQNHLAELGFATLTNRGRAVMHRVNVQLKTRYKLWHEAFKMVTLLGGLMPITIDGTTATRYEQWGGKNPAFTKHLKTWGESGTVKLKIKATPRVTD
jgi:hypothetical protein